MGVVAKVITGGQTGADQGALRAAKFKGIPTGGYAPAGWMTESGPAPWLAEYGLEETNKDYPGRTNSNVRSCDVAIWFGESDTPGFRCTARACKCYGTEMYVHIDATPADVADWILSAALSSPLILMVAGNRESKNPGIGDMVEKFLGEVFAILASDDKKE